MNEQEILSQQATLQHLTNQEVRIIPKSVNFIVSLTTTEYSDIAEKLPGHEKHECYIINVFQNGNQSSRNFYLPEDVQTLRNTHADLNHLTDIDFLDEMYTQHTKTFNLDPSFSHIVNTGYLLMIDEFVK